MSVHDKELWRRLNQELNRRASLDFGEARTSVTRGVGFISGVVRPQTGVFLDMKEELKTTLDVVRRNVPGLRDLVIDARIEIASKR